MILVCGGAGYIGSHTVKILRKQGIPHIVLDNLSKGHVEAVEGSELVVGDIADEVLLKGLLQNRQVTTVMHFAASIEVGESVVEPARYYDNNVIKVHHLIGSMLECEVKRFIFSSTAAVYGEPQQIPIPESHPKNPTSPYGNTKLAIERLLQDYDRAYGLKSVCLRYFNACGADPEGELGEDHSPETHLIPRVIFSVLGRAPELKLFGTDYDTPDGTCIRDYVHVEDLGLGHIVAVNHLQGQGESKAYNLGHGEGYSNRQIIDTVTKVTGKKVNVVETDRRPGDPARLIADSSLIRKELGWKPMWTDLEEIVNHAYRWYQNHPNGYKS